MILHNEILVQFLDDYAKPIYGRQLVGKVSMSQKSIALELNRLEKEHVLNSRKVGNIKFFSLNIKNPAVKDILVAAELSRKRYFLQKHKVIANIFRHDSRIVGIFGSYAKDTQNDDSDLDVFIIGEGADEFEERGRLFNIDVSVKYFSEDDLSKPTPLVKEMIKNHIIIFNAEHFVDILWRDFYGFD